MIYRWLLVLALFGGLLRPEAGVRAYRLAPRSAPLYEATAFDLIIAMNTLRVSNGLPALVEDPIINAVAQSTAQIMADNQMSWHIGNISGRLASAGYGGGVKVWATENFAVGNMSIDEIMVVWADDAHMIPAVNPAYCNVGAGVAKSSNGMTYYVLQAAYLSSKACGEYKSPGGGTSGGSSGGSTGGVPQVIVPVKIAEPDKDGNVYHVVQPGQSFWSIAIAYKITIKDLEIWNNLSKDVKLQIGQRLFIPGPNTKGYATPTPVGMIQVSKPDKDGKIVHTVASYQTLSTISQAYGTKVDTILALNNIQADWPLQIGQKLTIQPSKVTPSPTPRPLTPIEKLTPASDGKYYHTIQSGQSLSWIADLYKVPLADLMAWNGLNAYSIIYPDQKLVLQVTPPASPTATAAPATATRKATKAPPTRPPTQTPTMAAITSSPTGVVAAASTEDKMPVVWFTLAGLGALGLFLVIFFSRKR